MEKDKKISDLPSNRELSSALPILRAARGAANLALKIGMGGQRAQQIVESADAVLDQSEILTLPDRFNAAFADRGWFATSSLSVDAMRAALASFEEGDLEAADQIILDWLSSDNINLFAITRSKLYGDTTGRWHQLREALALTEEERYWSAVPLILIVCDGFASDILGTSPFEKNADLSLFDSTVAHPSSLPAAVGLIKKGVRKSSDEDLSLPMRHGILHGRSLGYANRLVCGKAWFLMIALVDWAKDKRDEEKRRAESEARASFSWSEAVSSLKKNQADKEAISLFDPMKWDGPFGSDLIEEEPPFAYFEFLTGWKTGNFGLMAKRAVNITKQKQGHLAGRMRSDADMVELIDFEILSVAQTSVARAEARVRMNGRTPRGEVSGEFQILAFRHTADGNVAMPSDVGKWHVQQGCIFDLMHERTIERCAERRQNIAQAPRGASS